MADVFGSPLKRLGILGGGQLGKMLAAEAKKLDIAVVVLDPNPQAPARSTCDEFLCGSFAGADAVRDLVTRVDVTTIEIEHVDVAALAELESAGHSIFPPPAALAIIQDKLVQKQHLADAGIPVPRFAALPDTGGKIDPAAARAQGAGTDDLSSSGAGRDACEDGSVAGARATVPGGEMLTAARRFGLPAVQKTRFGGYDGRGVTVLDAAAEAADLLRGPTMVEELVTIREEISVIVARSAAGNMRSYLPCRMVFDPAGNICTRVELPAWPEGTSGGEVSETSRLEETAVRLAEASAECLGIVGLLAVEMFVTPDGAILVNEVAPRPHNSGHLTIEACVTSQFEQHVRAVCGLPLGSTRALAPAVMVNVLGTGTAGSARVSGLGTVMALEGVTPHLYGKKESRPFRKMGHVTIVGENLAACRATADAVEATLVVDGA